MQELFLELAKLSLIGSLFSAVVILLRLVFQKAPKWVFCLLWGMVALRLICPFTIESSLSLVPDNLANGQILSNVEDTYIGRGETIEFYDNAVPEGNRQPIGSFVTEEGSLQPAKTIGNTVFPVLGWIWLAGMISMFFYTAASYLTLYKKMEEATHLQDNIWQCEQVDSPFVLGFIKPRIYLPYAISDVDIANVIAHEQAHIHRKDHWWKPIGFLILSVHWFNPILWLAYILLCRDIETACDEKVVKHMGKDEVRAYSTALLNYSIQRRRIAACPLAFGEVGVKERVKSVMNYKKPTLWIIIAAVVICAVVAVCFLTNPNTDIDEKLSVFIDCQIADHFQTEQSEENACCVNWKVLGTEKRGSVTSVYMWVLYDEYCKIDRGIKQVTSTHTPTLITVKREAGEYKLIEYWEPKAGGLREPSIREKFPEYLQDEALDPQRYYQTQLDENEKIALEYFGFNVVSSENTAGLALKDALIIIDNDTGEIVGNGENAIEPLLNGDIIIKDNDSGKIIYDGSQNEPLPPTYVYMVDNVRGDIIDLVNSPMTASQLISFFVNGGKEMLDGPVNQDVHIAKRDVQQKATIHSIVVNTASVTFRYTYGADAVQEPGEFGDVKVVLTDGTVINGLGPYGVPGDNGEFISTYATTTIIPKEDIDYVQVGETIVAITQITHYGHPMIPAP